MVFIETRMVRIIIAKLVEVDLLLLIIIIKLYSFFIRCADENS